MNSMRDGGPDPVPTVPTNDYRPAPCLQL